MILLVSGCTKETTPKISEEEAKTIVIQEHTKQIGQVDIVSITHKGRDYTVQWENKQNCENGTDYINDHNGTIKKGVTSIC